MENNFNLSHVSRTCFPEFFPTSSLTIGFCQIFSSSPPLSQVLPELRLCRQAFLTPFIARIHSLQQLNCQLRSSEVVMGVAPFNGRGVGLGFGIGCGFGIGWGFGGAPLNILGIGVGGGCGVGLGLGWGFGAAYGTKYLDSKLRFEGIDFDKLKAEHEERKRIKESSSQQLP